MTTKQMCNQLLPIFEAMKKLKDTQDGANALSSLYDETEIVMANAANDLADEYAALQAKFPSVSPSYLTDAAQDNGNQAEIDLANFEAAEYAALKAPAVEKVPVKGPGAFEVNGKVYRVQKSKGSNRLYAKVLVGKTFEYVSGAIYKISESDRVSEARAVELSAMIGACLMCGKTLTATTSVLMGIGPVCIKKVA